MTDPVTDPVAALRRIAFLLERRLADSYRIKAYRGAAATLLTVDADEIRARAEAGTLRQLPGVGAKTAGIVEECLAGGVPGYLTELEATAGPLVDGGEEYRAALRGDLHTHSDWSDGGSPLEEMAMTALELGHAYVVLTDHSPRLRVANGLSVERLTRQLEVVDAVNTHLGASGESRRMVAAVRHPRTNVLGHCTGRLVKGGRGTRPQSEFDAEAVFGACAEHDVAVEINSRPERSDPPDDLIGVALEAGCLFSIDSDAHAPGQLDFLGYGAERAQRLGVPLDRIVNTWPAERLLTWANG
jgi:putative hydrolase